MTTESTPSIEVVNKQLDRSFMHELRKPLAAGALAIMGFAAGNQIDHMHQPRADELHAELEADFAALPKHDQAVAQGFFNGEALPEESSSQLRKEAVRLSDLQGRQSKEEHPLGEGVFNLFGTLATIYAGWKLTALGLGRSLARDDIKRNHPDLAPARLKSHAEDVITEGGFVEVDEAIDDRFGWVERDAIAFFKQRLRSVGVDIKTSLPHTLDANALEDQLADMLDRAQFENMTENMAGSSNEALPPTSIEALQLRIINDLWRPVSAFPSIKEWYAYRRSQVIEPHAFHTTKNQLQLPEYKEIPGGIGVAVARVAHYLHESHTCKQQADADDYSAEASMALAVRGAKLLDQLAPMDNGDHWVDYVDSLIGGSQTKDALL